MTKNPTYDRDDLLSITSGQVLGTHNSYHIEPEGTPVNEWMYSHPPLDEQAQSGIRQFELDVIRDPEDGEIRVLHFPLLDAESNCDHFENCLNTLKDWSDKNPWHFPLIILIEPKDELADWTIENHLEQVDLIIESVWGDSIWRPRDQKGNAETLRDATENNGWPNLEILRGKAIFTLLDTGPSRQNYSANLSDISERSMFILTAEDHPLSSVFLRDDPIASQDDINRLSEKGFLIRTRLDSSLSYDPLRQETARSTGAHALSTDLLEEQFWIDPKHPISCNPITLSDSCRPEDLE